MGAGSSNFNKWPGTKSRENENNSCTEYDEHIDYINMEEETFTPWEDYKLIPENDKIPGTHEQKFKNINTYIRNDAPQFGIVTGWTENNITKNALGLSGYMVSFGLLQELRGGMFPPDLNKVAVAPDYPQGLGISITPDFYYYEFDSKGISRYCSEIGYKITKNPVPGSVVINNQNRLYEWYPAIHPKDINGNNGYRKYPVGYPWIGQSVDWSRSSGDTFTSVKPANLYRWQPAKLDLAWGGFRPVYPDENGEQETTGIGGGSSVYSDAPILYISMTLSICQRVNFVGDPITCCIMDHDCAKKDVNNVNAETCFEKTDRKETCSPLHRNLGSRACLLRLAPYCSGSETLAGYSYMNLWDPKTDIKINNRSAKNICFKVIMKSIYIRPEELCTQDAIEDLDFLSAVELRYGNIAEIRNILETLVEKVMLDNGGRFFFGGNEEGDIVSVKILKDQLLKICHKSPILCQTILPSICSDVTKDTISKFPDAYKMCGCFMDQKEYHNPSGILTRECLDFCVYSVNNNGIPVVDERNTVKMCESTVCTIGADFLNFINVQNSETGGILNFSQICSMCGNNDVIDRFYKVSGEDAGNQRKAGEIVALKEIDNDITFEDYSNIVNFIPMTKKDADRLFRVIYEDENGANENVSCSIKFKVITKKSYREFLYRYRNDPNSSAGFILKINNTLELLEDVMFEEFNIVNGYEIINPGSGYGLDIKVHIEGIKVPPKVELARINFYAYIYTANGFDYLGRDHRRENSSCICDMNINFYAENSSIGKLNLFQNCGTVNCYDDDGNLVDCPEGDQLTSAKDAIDDLTKKKKDNQFAEMFLFVVVATSVLFVLYILFYSINRYLISKLIKNTS